MATTVNHKERTHRLIRQGGLIDVAGLKDLDAGLLLGLLQQSKSYLDGLNEQQKEVLQQSGDALLQQRYDANKQSNAMHSHSTTNPFLR